MTAATVASKAAVGWASVGPVVTAASAEGAGRPSVAEEAPAWGCSAAEAAWGVEAAA